MGSSRVGTTIGMLMVQGDQEDRQQIGATGEIVKWRRRTLWNYPGIESAG